MSYSNFTGVESREESSKCWCFTLNNPVDDDVPKSWNGTKYLAYQRELGSNGTPHLQGYVVFLKKCRFSAVKKLEPKAHWEKRRGTHAQARDYATKEESRVAGPWITGAAPHPGRRSDLIAVKTAIDSNRSDRYLWDNYFPIMLKYERSFNSYRLTRYNRFQRQMPETIVLYGPTGTGKSHLARAMLPRAYWLEQGTYGNVWWDGYQLEQDVIIDEFYGWIKFHHLLKFLDKYPTRAETRKGSLPFLGERIIITSNVHPREWYKKLDYQSRVKALERRITQIWKIRDRDDLVLKPLDLSPKIALHPGFTSAVGRFHSGPFFH